MFYQGETIPISISCDDKIKLSEYDFVMLVYPQYDNSKILEIRKHDFIKETLGGEERYRYELSHEKTSELPAGDYVIEIMIPEKRGFRSVYQKLQAFTLKFSNAKKIEL